jgi:hypothetical protein
LHQMLRDVGKLDSWTAWHDSFMKIKRRPAGCGSAFPTATNGSAGLGSPPPRTRPGVPIERKCPWGIGGMLTPLICFNLVFHMLSAHDQIRRAVGAETFELSCVGCYNSCTFLMRHSSECVCLFRSEALFRTSIFNLPNRIRQLL